MAATKLLNIFALSTLATLLCSFAPSQSLALAVGSNHLVKRLPNHHGIAKKKKRDTARCKPRSSSSAPPPTTTPQQDLYQHQPSSAAGTPTPTPTPTPTSTPSGRGKLGVAWALNDDPRLHFFTDSSRVSIIHLWNSYVSTSVAAAKSSGIDVSIMLWGGTSEYIDPFVQSAKPGYATHAYGPNEVNQYDQANLDVPTTINLWFTYIQPLADQGYTLGGPVTTSAPDGFDWMTTFIAQCGTNCKMSEMPLHWYDTTFEKLQEYVEKWSGFKMPMRVTEFACTNFNGADQPDMGQVWDFVTQAINYFEGNSQILSYAPFGAMDSMVNVDTSNQLFVPHGNTLTDLGWKYVNGN